METSKSVLAALPEATRALFQSIRAAPGIDAFVLVGGTALALRLMHRLSEDLDFVTVGRLDRNAVVDVLNHLHACGHKAFTKIDKPLTRLELADSNADIDDYGQDWRVDGVKLTFFAKRLADPAAQQAYEARINSAPVPGLDTGRLRVATERFIFATKAQVLGERLLSRDLFDLKLLIETGRYSFEDLVTEAVAIGASADFIRERLVNGALRSDDAPVNRINGEVVNVESLRNWFVEQVNEYERGIAARAKRG